MATATRYLQLFLPTVPEIPAEQSWGLWRPLLDSYWSTWGNSPGWEVDIMRLYSRLARHWAGRIDWEAAMTQVREDFTITEKVLTNTFTFRKQ